MLSILPRETAVRLKADTTYDTSLNHDAYVVSGFSRTLEIEEATVFPIIVIERHSASRRRMSRAATAIVAIAAASIGLVRWQRAASTAPVFPSAPALFAAPQASSRWGGATTAVATAVLPLVDGVDVFLEAPAAPDAAAADAGGVRAALLRGEIPSLAIDMLAEPRKAVLRVLSPTLLEVEAGPVLGPVRDIELVPSPEVSLVQHVSVREYRVHNRPGFVRARILLKEAGQGNIRVAGRFLYVDFVTPRYESF